MMGCWKAKSRLSLRSMAKSAMVKRPRGRPSIYTDEMAEEICRRLAGGESLNAICKGEGYPSEAVVRDWAANPDHPFSAKYAYARDQGLDHLAEETLLIADDDSRDTASTENGPVSMPVVVARDRLRVDTRKWYLSKLAPKRYGDRLLVNADTHNTNVNVNLDLNQLARDVAFMLAMADAQSQSIEHST